MKQRPSRHRRLDDALAALPLDEPMLLTELDGFLTGILVCPEPISADEWMGTIWGSEEGGIPPFDEPADVRWFADAVMARCDEIARDLRRGKPQPIFDVDERNGDVLWELWIDGFAEAMSFRPDRWDAVIAGENRAAADAMARLSTLIAIADEDSTLDSLQINAISDDAPAIVAAAVLVLYAAMTRDGGSPVVPADPAPRAVGRNDPCRCGSGRKSKRCCG